MKKILTLVLFLFLGCGKLVDIPIGTKTSIDIYPGDNIQEKIDAESSGATFFLHQGIYRLQTIIINKNDITLMGESGTILNGSELLTDWIYEPPYWVIINQTQDASNTFWRDESNCEPGWEACWRVEDLFFDDVPLKQVLSLGISPGEWYFDYDSDKIYIIDDPAGHIVETSVLQYAITNATPPSYSGNTPVNNITIQNITIEKYASNFPKSAVYFDNSSNIRIQDCEIKLCHRSAIAFVICSDVSVIDSHIHSNGESGIGAWRTTNGMVRGNELDNNNYNHNKRFVEASGLKIAECYSFVIDGNYAHNNYGKGLWDDGGSENTVFSNNTASYNSDHGIFEEISYWGTIFGNDTEGNGYYGIVIDSSPDAEAYDNSLKNNGLSQMAIRSGRAGEIGPQGAYILRNLWVHENKSGGATLIETVGISQYFTQGIYNNNIDNNSYYLTSPSSAFKFLGVYEDQTVWKNRGYDANSTFILQ